MIFITLILIVISLIYIKSERKKLKKAKQNSINLLDDTFNQFIDNQVSEITEKSKKTTYYFDLAGTEVGNRDETIQRVAKKYVKEGLIWGKYDELTTREIKDMFPTEDDPIWEISILESIDVNLYREPNNQSDKDAVSVRLKTGEVIGYIEKKDIETFNEISNQITSIKAHFKGGKYKYVDYDDFGDEKIVTGYTKYNFYIGVTASKEFLPSENYLHILNDFSASSFIEPIQPKLLTEIPNYIKARKYEDRYVIIDFETTGLKPEQSEIIQIGAIKYENDVEVERFSKYVKPVRSEISETITKITGINDLQVKNSPTFSEIYTDLLKFISGYTLVAHNASFDMGFLLLQLAEHTNEIPKFRVFDTLPPSKRKLDFLKDRKLETIKKFLDVNTGSHDAIEDCVTTAALYQYLKRH
ncbi:exonuclease domain-containing protein [Lactococcus petauri]|nr:exonuclease domain-containing protein [Lactococcus petauri]